MAKAKKTKTKLVRKAQRKGRIASMKKSCKASTPKVPGVHPKQRFTTLTPAQFAGPWTLFWDMHSGGGLKEKFHYLYIQAPLAEAKVIFYNRFGHNPDRVSCTCCGPDYSIDEDVDLFQASGFHRKCRSLKTPQDENGLYKNDLPILATNMYQEDGETPPEGFEIDERWSSLREGRCERLEEHIKRDDVAVIFATDIKPEERVGEIPEQGYVWKD